jgi:hypothetical protein
MIFRDGGRSSRDEDMEVMARERNIELRGRRDSGGSGSTPFAEGRGARTELGGVCVAATASGIKGAS